MELSRNSCRLCLSESEFNIPLLGSFSRRTNMLDKILVCLNIVIEESDVPNTICYKCANKIENYYDFTMSVKKSQTKLGSREFNDSQRMASRERSPVAVSRRHVAPYVREQAIDADYTFSCLDVSIVGRRQEANVSKPFFSYLTDVKRQSNEPAVWKTPLPRRDAPSARAERVMKQPSGHQHQHQHSPDLFESQSQSAGSFDWQQLVPDNNLLKLLKEKCFGRYDF